MTIAAASSTNWADAMDFHAAMMCQDGHPALACCALDGTLRTSTSSWCSLSCSQQRLSRVGGDGKRNHRGGGARSAARAPQGAVEFSMRFPAYPKQHSPWSATPPPAPTGGTSIKGSWPGGPGGGAPRRENSGFFLLLRAFFTRGGVAARPPQATLHVSALWSVLGRVFHVGRRAACALVLHCSQHLGHTACQAC